MANINLSKLRDEIDNRKRGRNDVSSKLGESTSYNNSGAPRDSFLNGLIESLTTGRETVSSVRVKSVDNLVGEKKGEKNKLPIRNVNQAEQYAESQPHRINENEMSQERDDKLYSDMEKLRKQTLVSSISDFNKPSNASTPIQSNSGYPQQINEAYLTENVKNIVNNYLVENFGPVVEEAIKSTILEMYAVERIKEVLHENKDLIRTVVIETIKEIQIKNKQKAQS